MVFRGVSGQNRSVDGQGNALCRLAKIAKTGVLGQDKSGENPMPVWRALRAVRVRAAYDGCGHLTLSNVFGELDDLLARNPDQVYHLMQAPVCRQGHSQRHKPVRRTRPDFRDFGRMRFSAAIERVGLSEKAVLIIKDDRECPPRRVGEKQSQV